MALISAIVTITGFAIGKMIRKNTFTSWQPSIRADSSSSLRKRLKKLLKYNAGHRNSRNIEKQDACQFVQGGPSFQHKKNPEESSPAPHHHSQNR